MVTDTNPEHSPGKTPVLQFLRACAEALHSAADCQHTRAGSSQVQRALYNPRPLPCAATQVPLLHHLGDLTRSELVQRFDAITDQLPWKPSARSDDEGQQMALCNFNEMFDLGSTRLGLMLVRANCSYPEHQHRPRELYLVLSGSADWRYGGNTDYRKRDVHTVLYNHPMDVHGVRAGSTTLLALYALWPD